MESLGPEKWVEIVSAVIAILLGLWQIKVTIWPWLKRKWIKLTVDKCDELAEVLNHLKAIQFELKPNGGSSLRDAIDNLGTELREVSQLQYAFMSSEERAMFRTDAQGNCTWVNRAYTKLTGRSFQELRGHGWENVLHPQGRAEFAELWYKAIEHERAFEETIMYQDSEGDPFPVFVKSFTLLGTHGNVIGYLGVVNPIVKGEI